MTVAIDTVAPRLVWPKYGIDLELDLLQGSWTEEQYLKLTNHSKQLIEFTDGDIEALPMPTRKHQAISLFLLLAFLAIVRPRGGATYYAPLRLQIRPGKFREPDLLVLLDANDPRNQDAYWLGADLVVEIVSPDDPERDTVVKRADYAEAGIPEYWIVNPIDDTITVLSLVEGEYTEHGSFRRGEHATSAIVEGLAVKVDEVLDAE